VTALRAALENTGTHRVFNVHKALTAQEDVMQRLHVVLIQHPMLLALALLLLARLVLLEPTRCNKALYPVRPALLATIVTSQVNTRAIQGNTLALVQQHARLANQALTL
jgi:hypothetical protein